MLCSCYTYGVIYGIIVERDDKMFGRNKNKEVHNLIMEQVNDVENTLIKF